MKQENEDGKFHFIELNKEYDELGQKLQNIHDPLIEITTKFGYAIEAIKTAKNNLAIISGKQNEYPEFGTIIDSAFNQAVRLNQIPIGFETNWDDLSEGIDTINYSLMTTCSTSGSMISTFDEDYLSPIGIPSFLKSDPGETYEKLAKISLPLVNSYKEIEQIYFGTNADNTRGALPMMRQTFDHFLIFLHLMMK